MSEEKEPIFSGDTGSARRSTPQKMFGIFVVLLATATAGVTIGAFVDLQGLEHAESGNLVRAEFVVNDTRKDHYDRTHFSRFRIESGVLSQSRVRVTFSEGYFRGGKKTKEQQCDVFAIDGPDDTTGWYRLGYEFSIAVGATKDPASTQTQRNLFAAGTMTENASWPAGANTNITSNFYMLLQSFNSNSTAATNDLLTDYDVISDRTITWHVNGGPAQTTTTTTTEEESGGGDPDDDLVFTTTAAPKSLCTTQGQVNSAKFFYSAIKFHGVDSTPRRGTEALVFTKATKAMTNALSVVSADTDVSCFLKQYHDDAHALLMQFEALETFGIVHIASVFVILILAAMVAHMLRSVGTMSLATMMLFIGSSVAYVCYFSWAIGHHVKRVVDAVEEAIPSVTNCGPANGINVMYDTDAGTTETLYMIVFGMSVAVGACSLALILSKSERGERGSQWNSFN
jgi:hypothetical protein